MADGHRPAVGVELLVRDLEPVELVGQLPQDTERLGRRALPSLGYPLTTGGRSPLPPDFFLRLSWNLSRFVLPQLTVNAAVFA